MPHHRRLEEPNRYWLISNRTHRGEFLFRPDDECRRITKGCLARETQRKDVDLVAFVFTSNHFHLVARFPAGNRAAFMRDFQGELAERINKHRDRSGTVFPKPYHAEAILDVETLLDKISYTANNPVRHGLVSRPERWPGVGSSALHDSGDPLVGRWLDHNEWHNLQRREKTPPRAEAMIEYTVELHVPACLPGDDEPERRTRMCEHLEQGRKWFCREAGLEGRRRVTPPARYKRIDWRTRRAIDESWCKTRRACAGTERAAVAAYLERRREIDAAYRQAAEAWKRGEEAVFPVGTYPPGRAQCVEQLDTRAPPTDAAP